MVIVEWILRTIGIFPHRNGFYYIRDIVKLTYSTNNITMKPLYEKVAEMHNVKVYSVHNSIRKAIEAAHNSKKLLNLNLILESNACDESRPLTNSELIFFITNFIKSESYDPSKSSAEFYKELKLKLI